MNIMCSLYLLQHVSANLYSHHQVVVEIHKKKSVLGKGILFTDKKFDILVSWL
jgi:hypothetical protein